MIVKAVVLHEICENYVTWLDVHARWWMLTCLSTIFFKRQILRHVFIDREYYDDI